jgi:hypothetical protein
LDRVCASEGQYFAAGPLAAQDGVEGLDPGAEVREYGVLFLHLFTADSREDKPFACSPWGEFQPAAASCNKSGDGHDDANRQCCEEKQLIGNSEEIRTEIRQNSQNSKIPKFGEHHQ